MNELFEDVLGKFSFNESTINQYSPLVFAYVGDAVFEVFVRTMLIHESNSPVNKLHKRSTELVKAKTQCSIIHRITDSLSQAEQDIVRRGRNAKSGTIPKNANVSEYKYATGFEALIGYLYLKNEHQRLFQILTMAVTNNPNNTLLLTKEEKE